jgi:hypothetical protein
MLWRTSELPRRLSPCGEVAIPFAGQPIELSESMNQHLVRWRD